MEAREDISNTLIKERSIKRSVAVGDSYGLDDATGVLLYQFVSSALTKQLADLILSKRSVNRGKLFVRCRKCK